MADGQGPMTPSNSPPEWIHLSGPDGRGHCSCDEECKCPTVQIIRNVLRYWAVPKSGGYRDLFDASIADPAAFWADAARAVTWTREPQRILDDSNPPFYRWFPDGELNTCANALDRHVDDGRAEQPALIYDSPVTGSQRTYTYRELLDETARFAGALRGLGVGKGDRVVIYMPMIPEAVIAMLACARLGAVHSVVFGGFAAHELAARIDDARPAVIVSASCGIEPTRTVDYKPMLDAALDAAQHPPRACVIVQREQRPASR